MNPPRMSLALALIIVTLSWVFLRLWCRLKSSRAHPPGPRGYPLVGSLLDLSSKPDYLIFHKWSKIYGDVMRVLVTGTEIIVLDSLECALDLMEKRAHIYSDRPHSTMLEDVVGFNWSLVLMNPGKRLTQHRRLFHRGFSKISSEVHRIQQEETIKMLLSLREDPQQFMRHIERWAKATIIRVTYGYIAKSENDRFINLSNRSVEAIVCAGQPGAYLVDFLPFLRHIPAWLPGATFKKEALVWGSNIKDVLELPMDYSRSKLAEKTLDPCFVRTLLDPEETETNAYIDEIAIKETAGIVHTAGADSLLSVVESFVLAMVLYPEVQSRAKEEIDDVIGKGRIPNFNDRGSLPYINNVFLETLRWGLIAPLGIAHQASCDDTYRGMFIRRGSLVMANVWSITRNEKDYPQPDKFIPERFNNKDAPDPRLYIFGYGRRICAGKEYAEDMAWTAMVSILAMFEINQVQDHEGRPLIPHVEHIHGLICHPKPFPCDFRVRSGVEELIFA